MTNTQATDNIMFIAALHQLARLAADKSLTDREFEMVKKDLERTCFERNHRKDGAVICGKEKFHSATP